eukprot:1144853-Pelagomonas_calceolata.AAC.7
MLGTNPQVSTEQETKAHTHTHSPARLAPIKKSALCKKQKHTNTHTNTLASTLGTDPKVSAEQETKAHTQAYTHALASTFGTYAITNSLRKQKHETSPHLDSACSSSEAGVRMRKGPPPATPDSDASSSPPPVPGLPTVLPACLPAWPSISISPLNLAELTPNSFVASLTPGGAADPLVLLAAALPPAHVGLRVGEDVCVCARVHEA